jgi:hypothetical protein
MMKGVPSHRRKSARGQRGAEDDRCRKCGRKLSSYNNTRECWSHSTEDASDPGVWVPWGHRPVVEP